MRQQILSALIGVMTLGFFSQAWGAHFVNPTWKGYALDWCKNFEQDCGHPAADLYCQKRGYPQATGFQIRGKVNFPTMTIGQNAICNPSVHGCDSFEYIDCQETTKTFQNPVYNGYRLDWCDQFEGGCGQPAAQAYCQKQGFVEVINFQKQGQLTVPTMTIGSNAICNPKYHVCDSFSFIQCKK